MFKIYKKKIIYNMILGIVTLIVNIIKIIYSLIFTLLLVIFDYNENIFTKFLDNFNVYGTIENLDKYYEFKKKHNNGIALFNHTSYLDGVILLKECKEPLSFVCAKNIIIDLLKNMVNRWDCIVIEKKTNSTEKITNKVLNREKNDPVLFIAPSGGDGMTQKNKDELGSFRTGAFVSLSPVLPILISYSPHTYIEANKEMIESIIDILNTKKLYYKVKVLDPIYPRVDDTIETFRDYVYETMNNEKKNVVVEKIEPKDNKQLFTIIIIIMIISYVLFSSPIKEYIVVLLIVILFIVLCLREKYSIYNYLYKNLIYLYGLGLSLYSLSTQNYILFINSIIYPLLYNIFTMS